MCDAVLGLVLEHVVDDPVDGATSLALAAMRTAVEVGRAHRSEVVQGERADAGEPGDVLVAGSGRRILVRWPSASRSGHGTSGHELGRLGQTQDAPWRPSPPRPGRRDRGSCRCCRAARRAADRPSPGVTRSSSRSVSRRPSSSAASQRPTSGSYRSVQDQGLAVGHRAQCRVPRRAAPRQDRSNGHRTGRRSAVRVSMRRAAVQTRLSDRSAVCWNGCGANAGAGRRRVGRAAARPVRSRPVLHSRRGPGPPSHADQNRPRHAAGAELTRGPSRPGRCRPRPAGPRRQRLAEERTDQEVAHRAVRLDAAAARSRSPLRPPDPPLEPQDAPVHLRRAQRDPHHRPRPDRPAPGRRPRVRPRDRRPRRPGPVRRHQEAGPGADRPRRPPGPTCPTSTSAGSAACSPTS